MCKQGTNKRTLRPRDWPFQEQFCKENFLVVGDGLQTRDFTDVRDVVEANILSASCKNDKAFGEIFNIGTGKSFSTEYSRKISKK